MSEISLFSQFHRLQEILCCPHSKAPLSLISVVALLERLPENERHRVPEGTVGAFVSEPLLTAYPIVGRIVDFLEQDSLPLSEVRNKWTVLDAESESVMQSVKHWYDEFGWQRNEAGTYNDTAVFSQRSLTAHGLYELSSHLSLLDRLTGGDFVLDAASGAIPHPEYAAFSWFYKYRTCVDVSLTALREADAKLAGRGFCCMANICNLPFREEVFDSVVSAYTVQHIAASKQFGAIAELYRVLKPGGHLCVVSEVQQGRGHRTLMLAARAIRKVQNMFSVTSRTNVQFPQGSSSLTPPKPLYCALRDLAWWRNLARALSDSYAVEGLRIFKKEEFELLFRNSMRTAKTVRVLETLFPELIAPMCAYVLLNLSKKIAGSR
jgi:SAM-dependent methyltransferase/uncharacterized protein YbaR (Trm112 family)